MLLYFYLLAVCSLLNVSFSKQTNERTYYEGFTLYAVEGDESGLKELMKTHDLNAHVERNKANFLIAPELVQIFEEAVRTLKLEAKVEVQDFSELLRTEKPNDRADKGFSWKAYYDIDAIYTYLQNVSKVHPDTTEMIVGGESYERRQIIGLRINTPSENKNNKPVVFIESGIHAREWITPAATTYFINQLLTSEDPEIRNLRDLFDWRIFPSVNPDGYTYSYNYDRMWRKTRSKYSKYCYGADPNRNWDYNWRQHGASEDPCDRQTYAGSKPFSEPETRSLSAYISSLENLLAYIGFHADAQLLLLPYSDSVEHVDNYDDLVQMGKASLDYGEKVNGERYQGPATAAEILYKVSGGSMDWVRNKLGTPIVYTYELRGTFFYWPPGRIPEQGDEVTQMMVGLFKEAGKLGYY